MSWNYRLVKTRFETENIIEIKEIYYDDNGKINGYGDAPVPYGETIEEVKECLDLMYEVLKSPIIDFDEIK